LTNGNGQQPVCRFYGSFLLVGKVNAGTSPSSVAAPMRGDPG
jgi:hypothetical protein